MADPARRNINRRPGLCPRRGSALIPGSSSLRTLRRVAAFALALAGGCAPSTILERRFYTLEVEGQRIGYAYHEREAREDERVHREVVRLEVAERSGQRSVERTVEVARDAFGRLRWIASRLKAGVQDRAIRAEVRAGVLHVTRQTGAGRRRGSLIVNDTTRLPDQLSVALAPLWTDQAQTLVVPYLEPQGPHHLDLRADRVADPSAERSGLRQVRLRSTRSDPAAADDLWFDGAGVLQRKQQPFVGFSRLTWRACSRDCDRTVESPYDALGQLTVASPYAIPERAARGPLRFVLTRSDGMPPRLVSTSEQALAYDGARAIVTVCSDCGALESPSPEELQHWSRPSAWIESDHPEILALARRAGLRKDVHAQMRRFERAVSEQLTRVETLGHASALEAARIRSGDCLEFALLLAALARSRGLPARIAIGMAYADAFTGKRQTFGPHAWVQVWDGARFVSYDAGLGGFDATHVTFAIGQGEPGRATRALQQLARLHIDKVGLVRR